MEKGFIKATSNNLPKVDIFMVGELLKNDTRFNSAEIRGAKAQSASRECYGDSAIGYVQIKRNKNTCTVKGKICPEHRIHNKAYSVSLTINEVDETIKDVQCYDCAAASGGCKHALAFLMWVHRRSEDPAPTDVACYWQKPRLACIGSTLKFVTSRSFASTNISQPLPDNNTFLASVIHAAKTNLLDSQLSRHNVLLPVNKFDKISIYKLMLRFVEEGGKACKDFFSFATNEMAKKLCDEAEVSTRNQAESPLWHELRFGRITASKLYEAAHCQSPDGSLVETITGAQKLRDTSAMQRGRRLEKDVLAVAENKIGNQFKGCGLYLLPNFPVLGASPDAIHEDFVVEVKCPTSEKALKRYLNKGKITLKYKAQLHMQMLAANKTKGIFCVAEPDFEYSKNIQIVYEDLDMDYINEIVTNAVEFWTKCIFKKLWDSAKL